jgi:hypothetical protein
MPDSPIAEPPARKTGPIIWLPIAVLLLFGASWWSLAAKPPGTAQCYKSEDPVGCFMAAAKGRLKGIDRPNERAEALVELLLALAGTEGRDDALLREALALSDDAAVKPVRQMDLLYSIDLYGSAGESLPQQTFLAALSRYAVLEKRLKGIELVELQVGACAIIAWDDAYRERWLEFARSVCAPERLGRLEAESVAERALVMAMMPVAMTLSESWEGFSRSASAGLAWLEEAEKRVARSKQGEERDFVAYMGVLMHGLNAVCLELFAQEDAADDEIERALKALRVQERRVGISERSTFMRRQVVELLFKAGREAEAKKLLKQMLGKVDADPKGRRIPAAEQIAILALAARLEYEERAAREDGQCVPEGTISI